MPTNQLRGIIHNLRRVFLRQGAGMTDAQLLTNFIDQHEEAALATLMARHGPMVWGVCRRLLRNHHDAEDAFQATFLVLVRKAKSILPRELVGNWLHGVAYQIAWKVKTLAMRRKVRERQVEEMPEVETVSHEHSLDWQWLLDQEVSRLPEKYRAAVVLCDLEGKTLKEAAEQFGVPYGMMANWLNRGRVLLVKRLRRQGVVLSVAGLVALLVQQVTFAQMPAALARSTLKAANCLSAGQAIREVVSPEVVTLTEGVLQTMLFRKLKLVALALLAFLVCSWALLAAVQADAQVSTAAKRGLKASYVAAVAVQGKEDAQKLFEAMEQKLAKAKAYKVSFEFNSKVIVPMKCKGTLTAANNNRMNLTCKGTTRVDADDIPMTHTVISDGTTLATSIERNGETEPPIVKNLEGPLHERLTECFRRRGLLFAYYVAAYGDPQDPPSQLKPRDFKMIGKDKIGGRDANIIEYQAPLPTENPNDQGLSSSYETTRCRLWLDVQSGLPLKRTLEFNGEVRHIETYSNWELDPKLPEDTFKLPK